MFTSNSSSKSLGVLYLLLRNTQLTTCDDIVIVMTVDGEDGEDGDGDGSDDDSASDHGDDGDEVKELAM